MCRLAVLPTATTTTTTSSQSPSETAKCECENKRQTPHKHSLELAFTHTHTLAGSASNLNDFQWYAAEPSQSNSAAPAERSWKLSVPCFLKIYSGRDPGPFRELFRRRSTVLAVHVPECVSFPAHRTGDECSAPNSAHIVSGVSESRIRCDHWADHLATIDVTCVWCGIT